MKKIILALLIVLVPSLAHAMFPVISDPVTRRAESFQGTWFECGVGTSCSGFSSGFKANQHDDGLANEFVLEETYILKGVSGWYIPDSLYEGSPYTPSFDIRLYQGTRLSGSNPDNNVPGGFLFWSWTVQTPYTYGQNLPPTTFSDNDLYRVDNLNIVLPAGKYWIAVQAGGDGLMSPGNAYGNVVPEPSAILLFGSGLLGVFVRRRKRV